MKVKMVGENFSLSTATTAENASVVRIYNDAGGDALITRKAAGGATLGSCVLPDGAISFFEKEQSDTIEANTAVSASAVAYSS